VSVLLGVLQVTGRGGNELYVFDDAVVRAATGLGAALLGALDSSTAAGAEALTRAVSGAGFADKTPEQLTSQSKTNALVWSRDVTSAALAKGRWPSTGLRRLTLTLRDGRTVEHSWPGDGATRPLNHDAYAISLLSKAFPGLLDVHLGKS
jgi:hypothetical protein